MVNFLAGIDRRSVEAHIHGPLVSGPSIFQAKKHHYPLVVNDFITSWQTNTTKNVT